jgi:hypothetical protein
MKPSVGRIVLVPMDPTTNNGADVAPAVVTRVWSDTCINVRVLADSENLLWRTSVTHVESLDGAAPHNWAWPPRI